jgi:Rod binding domain-containing protein
MSVDGADSLPGLAPAAQTASLRRLESAGRDLRRGDVSEAAREFERLFATLLDEHLGSSLAAGRGLGMRIALERDLGTKQSALDAQPEDA